MRITGGHTGGSSRKTGIIHWIAGCQTGGIAGSWHQNWTVTLIKNTIRKTGGHTGGSSSKIGIIHWIAGGHTGGIAGSWHQNWTVT